MWPTLSDGCNPTGWHFTLQRFSIWPPVTATCSHLFRSNRLHLYTHTHTLLLFFIFCLHFIPQDVSWPSLSLYYNVTYPREFGRWLFGGKLQFCVCVCVWGLSETISHFPFWKGRVSLFSGL